MNQYVDQSIALWVIFMSVIAFLLYGLDKYRTVHHRWRIPEQTLVRYSVALWMREPDGMTYEEILLYYVVKSRYAGNIATVDRAAF